MKKTSVLVTEKNFPIAKMESSKNQKNALYLSAPDDAKNFQQETLQMMAGKTAGRVGQIKGEIRILTIKQAQNGLRGML